MVAIKSRRVGREDRGPPTIVDCIGRRLGTTAVGEEEGIRGEVAGPDDIDTVDQIECGLIGEVWIDEIHFHILTRGHDGPGREEA